MGFIEERIRFVGINFYQMAINVTDESILMTINIYY